MCTKVFPNQKQDTNHKHERKCISSFTASAIKTNNSKSAISSKYASTKMCLQMKLAFIVNLIYQTKSETSPIYLQKG